MARKTFNWDDINCGDPLIDHSQHYFAMNTIKQEVEQVENISHRMAVAHIGTAAAAASIGNKENQQPVSEIKQESVSPQTDNAATELAEPNKAKNEKLEITGVNKTPPNMAHQWSTAKPRRVNGQNVKMMPPPPRAYLCKDHYEHKRQEALKRCLLEEKKKREFHSRPVPNFSASHERIDRNKLHQVTVPVTPKVLKNSRDMQEKRKLKLEEWKRNNPPPKFVPRPATAVKEEPFVPKKVEVKLEQRPFKLSSELRLQQRHEFDAATKKKLEEKQKKAEIERKQREEQEARELRKLTLFKAQPNPFK